MWKVKMMSALMYFVFNDTLPRVIHRIYMSLKHYEKVRIVFFSFYEFFTCFCYNDIFGFVDY